MAGRADSSPRVIKRKAKDDDESAKLGESYDFFQKIASLCVLRIKDENEKLIYSAWLRRLDKEAKTDRILHLIKIVCVSMRKPKPLYIFERTPPEDLSEINFDSDHTIDLLDSFQTETSVFNKNKEEVPETISKRSAAVSPDMLSYTCSKSSRTLVQSYFVKSAFPIYTWANPASIEVPGNIDHNEWELYLNRFNLLTMNKTRDRGYKKLTCEDIMKREQVSKEVTSSFSWHPYSVLFTTNKPKRTAAYLEVDQDIANQPIIQQQIDEAAFAVVHNKSFPGYKMLNPKFYYTALMPSPKYVFKMTAVKVVYNSISPCSFKSCTRQWIRVEKREDPDACCKRRPRCLKNFQSCMNDESTEKNLAERKLSCMRMTMVNPTDFQIPVEEPEKDDGGQKRFEELTCCAENCPSTCPKPDCAPKPKPECEPEPKTECKSEPKPATACCGPKPKSECKSEPKSVAKCESKPKPTATCETGASKPYPPCISEQQQNTGCNAKPAAACEQKPKAECKAEPKPATACCQQKPKAECKPEPKPKSACCQQKPKAECKPEPKPKSACCEQKPKTECKPKPKPACCQQKPKAECKSEPKSVAKCEPKPKPTATCETGTCKPYPPCISEQQQQNTGCNAKPAAACEQKPKVECKSEPKQEKSCCQQKPKAECKPKPAATACCQQKPKAECKSEPKPAVKCESKPKPTATCETGACKPYPPCITEQQQNTGCNAKPAAACEQKPKVEYNASACRQNQSQSRTDCGKKPPPSNNCDRKPECPKPNNACKRPADQSCGNQNCSKNGADNTCGQDWSKFSDEGSADQSFSPSHNSTFAKDCSQNNSGSRSSRCGSRSRSDQQLQQQQQSSSSRCSGRTNKSVRSSKAYNNDRSRSPVQHRTLVGDTSFDDLPCDQSYDDDAGSDWSDAMNFQRSPYQNAADNFQVDQQQQIPRSNRPSRGPAVDSSRRPCRVNDSINKASRIPVRTTRRDDPPRQQQQQQDDYQDDQWAYDDDDDENACGRLQDVSMPNESYDASYGSEEYLGDVSAPQMSYDGYDDDDDDYPETSRGGYAGSSREDLSDYENDNNCSRR